jgi:hypothetical protein
MMLLASIIIALADLGHRDAVAAETGDAELSDRHLDRLFFVARFYDSETENKLLAVAE